MKLLSNYLNFVLCSIVLMSFTEILPLLAEEDLSTTDKESISEKEKDVSEVNNPTVSDEDKYIINEDNIGLSDLEKNFIIAINKYRETNGKLPFKVNSTLMNEARKQASLMVYYGQQKNYLYRTEFPANKSKESVYYGPKDIEVVMEGLKNSTSNNEALLSDNMTHIGVGVISSVNNYRGSWTIRYTEIQNEKNLTKKTDTSAQVKKNKNKNKENNVEKQESKKSKKSKKEKSDKVATDNNKAKAQEEDTTNKNTVSTEDAQQNEKKESQTKDPAELSDEERYIINPEEVDLSNEEKEMIIAVNKYRARMGRRILKVSKHLMDGAREQSRLMLKYGQSHFLTYYCLGIPKRGSENIFYSPRSVLGAMRGFMHSPAHNGNMLSPYHSCIGVGAIIPTSGRGSWTQRFE